MRDKANLTLHALKVKNFLMECSSGMFSWNVLQECSHGMFDAIALLSVSLLSITPISFFLPLPTDWTEQV